MQEVKKKILKDLVPEAVLYPLSANAKESIKNQNLKDVVAINRDIFKIGRESRLSESEKGIIVKMRLFNYVEPNNDLYLIDSGKELQISKEHFQIEKKENGYVLKDRGSTRGMVINDIKYGGNNHKFEQILKDEDIIKIGSENSDYIFQFLILDI